MSPLLSLSLTPIALLLIGVGFWQLRMPLDLLWEKQERALLERGLSPQRNEVWERSARNIGYSLLSLGILVLLFAVWAFTSIPSIPSISPQMSGVTINGYQLTQAQWDSCHHDLGECSNTWVVPMPSNSK